MVNSLEESFFVGDYLIDEDTKALILGYNVFFANVLVIFLKEVLT